MTISPAPGFPERAPNVFERGYGSESRFPGGPRRFEEGVATDTDVPSDFARGAYGDTAPYSAQGADTNPEHVFKRANETVRERAHVGSSSWVEAPSVLSEFVDGASAGQGMPEFQMTRNPGTHMNRPAAARISD